MLSSQQKRILFVSLGGNQDLNALFLNLIPYSSTEDTWGKGNEMVVKKIICAGVMFQLRKGKNIHTLLFSIPSAALKNAGMSSGFLLVSRFPSTTTSASAYSAPAFLISWIIDFRPVTLRPFST